VALEVFIPTFNSERTLTDCLKSVQAAIPNAQILVIDKLSTDNTLKIARKFGARSVSRDSNLGEVRTLICERAVGPWFFMVDSDVILGKEWFSEMIKHKDELSRTDPRIGALSSSVSDKHTVLDEDIKKAHDIFFRWKEKTSIVADAPKKNPRRMLTCAVLLSKEACKGFSSTAFCFEDYELQKHIEKQGYSTYIVKATAWHDLLISKANLKKRSRCQGAGMRMHGETSFLRLLASALYVPLLKAPFGCKGFVFSIYWNYLVGWVKYKEYGGQSWS